MSRNAAEQARKDREAAAARTLYLDRLGERQEATWKDVTALIEMKQPGKLLRDLRDVTARRHEDATFQSAVRQLREVHRAKPSFLRRIGEAGL